MARGTSSVPGPLRGQPTTLCDRRGTGGPSQKHFSILFAVIHSDQRLAESWGLEPGLTGDSTAAFRGLQTLTCQPGIGRQKTCPALELPQEETQTRMRVHLPTAGGRMKEGKQSGVWGGWSLNFLT